MRMAWHPLDELPSMIFNEARSLICYKVASLLRLHDVHAACFMS